MTIPVLGRPTLAVELTEFCNLRCRHCYNAFDHARAQALALDELLSILARAFSEVEFGRVTLTGGEPLAYPGLVQVLELCLGRGIATYIISNATLVTPRLAERLPTPLTVQITLNGPDPATHDRAVGVPGAWRQALEGIEHLQRRGVQVVGCIVLTRRNAPLIGATLERMLGLGITTVALSRLMPAGTSAQSLDLLPTRTDLIQALRQASDGRFAAMTLRASGPIPPCLVNHAEFPRIYFGWCPIGTRVQDFALTPEGKLKQCLIFEPALGDLRRASIGELMQSAPVLSYRKRAPAFCRGCVELGRCLGGCGAAALAVSGDADALDPLLLQHVDGSFRRRVRSARNDWSSLPLPAS